MKGKHLQLSFNGLVVGDATDGALTAPGLTGLRAGQGALYSNVSVSAS